MRVRMQKINMEIQRQVTEVIQHEVDDPHVGMVSITRVDTSPDLKESKIYFSVLSEDKIELVTSVLDKMAKFIRHKLGQQLRLKILPELNFIHDDSIRYSVDIYSTIEELKEFRTETNASEEA